MHNRKQSNTLQESYDTLKLKCFMLHAPLQFLILPLIGELVM